MSQSKELPTVGSRDFYADASEALQKSDTPQILICGYTGCSLVYESFNIGNKSSARWFLKQAVKTFKRLESELPEDDE